MLLLFFSSRRRHTRCSRDWSSDVGSSDLNLRNVGLRGEVFPSRLRTTVGPASIVRICAARRRVWHTLKRQAEQAIDMPAPGIEQFAGGKGIGIYDGQNGPNALHPDGIPPTYELRQ